MSASSKKKLRNAEQAAKMTEKQLVEQKEAKKLKLYSTLAVVILVALVVFAAYVGITRTVANSGIRERNTVALTIGDEKVSNAEFNYFFVDAVNNFYSQYGSYASLLGLDTATPLDEQIINADTNETWADDFIKTTVENVKATYALANEAKANGYTLPEAAASSVEQTISTMTLYSQLYGYTDFNTYLKAIYGNGASEESLREYMELIYLSSAYQSDYYSNLTYTDEQLRAAEAENPARYSSYSYNYYYLSTNSFVEAEGTDSTEYTNEQLTAAAAKAEAAAKALTEGIYSVEAFDAAIAALPINAENSTAASYAYDNTSYSSISSFYVDWVTDATRKAGDMTYVASTANDAGVPSGYYVVMFKSSNDNTFALANVRHILAGFEGGSYDSTTGITTYTDEEKAAAKAKAEEIYNEWKNGEATEVSFAALANEKSDEGDGTTGGLQADVYPGKTVAAFENWCFDNREAGDTGIIETEYGYHVMYYSSDSETTYRNLLIRSELADGDYSSWYSALVEAVSATEGSYKYVNTGLTLGG